MVDAIFITECLLALVLHGLVLYRRFVQAGTLAAHPDAIPNGVERRLVQATASLLINVESTRFALNAVLLIVGLGVGFGYSRSLYALLLIPVISMASSALYLRGPR